MPRLTRQQQVQKELDKIHKREERIFAPLKRQIDRAKAKHAEKWDDELGYLQRMRLFWSGQLEEIAATEAPDAPPAE